MNKDPNQEAISDAIRNANPAVFPDLTDAHEALQAAARRNLSHTPRQQGPVIVCVSCPHQHTLMWIGVGRRLTGLNPDGSYVIS